MLFPKSLSLLQNLPPTLKNPLSSKRNRYIPAINDNLRTFPPLKTLEFHRYILATNGYLTFAAVLTGIMGAVLFVFAGWHVYIIGFGITTNEMQKWGGLKAFLAERYRRDCLAYEDWKKKYDEQRALIDAGEVSEQELMDKEELVDVPRRPTNWQKRMGR